MAFAVVAGPLSAQDPDTARAPAAAQVSADGAASPAEAEAVSRVRALLHADMPVTASRILARELSLGVTNGFEAVMLAARAYAAQRSWATVRRLLMARDWTDPALAREALLLLADAYVGLDSAGRAADTYQAYLRKAPDPVPAPVRVQFARALTRLDRPIEAAEQLAALAEDHPEIAHWARLSRFYALALAGDSSVYRLADTLARTPMVAPDSVWRAAAEMAFRLDDPERALSLLNRAGPGVRRALAEDHIAPYLLAIGDTAGARAALRSVIERGRARPETGPLLLALEESWRTLREIGESDVRAGRASRAAGYLSRALSLAPEHEQPRIAEALAGVYRSLGDSGRAIEILRPWLGKKQAPPARAASIWLLAARTFASLGDTAASADAYEHAAAGAGSSAAFAAYLIGDAYHDAERIDDARAAYLHAYRSFPFSTYGSRSLERLAMLDFREGRYAEARGYLEEYRRRYPRGSWVQGAGYWIGRTLEAERDTVSAHRFYRSTIDRDPLDYYAILAENRMHEVPESALRLGAAEPLVELAPVHAAALARMNLLRDVGWVSRARREYRTARDHGPRGWA